MSLTRTHEENDAILRVRAEVNLLTGKYSRRLKFEAERRALLAMQADPTRDPDEVGREAFIAAGAETGLIEGESAKALTHQA